MRTKNLIISFLLVVAVGLVFGVFMLVQPQARLEINTETATADLKAIQQDLARDGIPTTGLTVMTAPHFLGQDKSGKRWDIQAKKAVQQGTETGILRLYGLDAAVRNSRNQTVRFVAGEGTYDQTRDTLLLADNVEVRGEKFNLAINAFSYDLAQGSGMGEGAMALTSDLGTLRADHVTLQNNADRVILVGHVHARIKPRGQK